MPSTNVALARIFGEIADLLEIKQESTFRVNAYRRAARAVESLPEDIAAVAERRELRGIPGIGAALADKIDEFLRTGTMVYHRQLASELPSGLATLLEIPEIGPKTALLLYRSLGVADLDALERAARAGQIRSLPRMGAKTEQKILQGIERWRRRGTRVGLGVALPDARAIADALAATPGVEALSLAGSLRRMRDTVADVDIVVATRDADAVMARFVSLLQVAEVLLRGPTRSSVHLGRAGVQCDVRVVAPESYGAALQYFTGSKDHNVQLRELAVRRGLRINEYGVYRVETDERLPGTTEAEVYAAVGLPWIPPEIREGQGEIALAQRGALPSLVDASDIRGELHMHTTWSDGEDSAEQMARAAKVLGREYVCVTDHSVSLKIAGGVSAEALAGHRRDLAEIEDRVGVRVLMGAEVEILADGSLDYPDDVLASLDVAIGSVHSRMRLPPDEQTRRIVRALESGRLDVLGHPTGRRIGERPPMEFDLEAVVNAACRTDTALEINASPARLDLCDVHVRLARDRGALFEIGTDAHRVGEFGSLPYGIGTARRGWVEAARVINAWPLPTLLAFLAR